MNCPRLNIMVFLIVFGLLLIFVHIFFFNSGIVVLAQEISGQNKLSGMPYLKDPSLKVDKILSDLNMPTNMAFIKDNDFLILEKNGIIKRVINGIISEKPLLRVNVSDGFFQGMLGIAVSNADLINNNMSNSSNIPQSPLFVFLFYTEDKGDGNTPLGNRLYRYELVNDQLVNSKLLLDLPAIPHSWGNGGAITIGQDNNLYVTIGSVGNDKHVPQTMMLNYRNSTVIDGRGGILHITQDGQPVGEGILGNTYPLNLYFAYGIENSYGIDFDPLTNNLWDVENDGSHNDEINIVKPGFNSGYGMITGMSVESPAVPSALVNFSGNGIYKDPEFVWFKKPVATGLKFLSSDKLGQTYQNQLFVGGFLDGRIYNFSLNSDRTHLALPTSLSSGTLASSDLPTAEPIIFGEGFGGISNLVVGPDGYLYVVSAGSGSIYRITKADNLSSSESFFKNTSWYTEGRGIANANANANADTTTSPTSQKNAVNVSIEQDASDLGDKAFNPSTATIKPGNTIEWTNRDSVMHKIVQGNPSIPSDVSAIRPEASTPTSGFNSEIMSEGMTFRHIFDEPGTFNYYCSVHPTMTGVVIVSIP